MPGVDVFNGVSEGVHGREGLLLLVVEFLDGFPVVEQLLADVVFVADFEDFELVGTLHAHALADEVLEVFDLAVVDGDHDLHLLHVRQEDPDLLHLGCYAGHHGCCPQLAVAEDLFLALHVIKLINSNGNDHRHHSRWDYSSGSSL